MTSTKSDPQAVGDRQSRYDLRHKQIIERDVWVETRGQHTLGQTIVDFRRSAAPPDLNTRVCVEVDAARAREWFFATLGL